MLRKETATVAVWELRRLSASPLNYLAVVGLFAFFAGLVLFKHEWAVPFESSPGHRGGVLDVLGSTGLGLLFEVVGLLLLFFGVLIPFIAADAVARDQKQRVHEILMATPVSSTAFVAGRFTAALSVALLLSLAMMAGAAAADVLIQNGTAGYPSPSGAGLAVTWAVLVAPAVVVVSGVTFMVATLLPKLATAVKVATIFAWVALSVVVDIGHGLGWFGYWTAAGGP